MNARIHHLRKIETMAMFEEKRNNKVYFSDLLPERCPRTYSGLIEILDRYGVPHSLLKGTHDIWCRDYMPVQYSKERFFQFSYHPDYLLDTLEHRHSITSGLVVCRDNGLPKPVYSTIKVDGGNIVHCGKSVVMTSKVFEENPSYTVRELSRDLEAILGARIIFLPWDPEEIYGHADGILRFIDNDTVLMTNYRQFDWWMAERFRRCLEPHFKVLELKFPRKGLYENSWAYINWLQTDKVLILPKFNVPEDDLALEQISRAMPAYKGRIEMVDATDLIIHEGGLNCASWTVRE